MTATTSVASFASTPNRPQKSSNSLPILQLLLHVTVAIHRSIAAVISGEQTHSIKDLRAPRVCNSISQRYDTLTERAQHCVEGKGSKANHHFWPNNFNLLPQEK
jgi:hypothetical protein